MVQDIPSPAVDYSKELHNMNLKGKWDVDWGKKHKEHISYWDSRLQHVLLVDNVGVGFTDRYDIWYGDVTRPYHTRIAAAGSYMIHIFDRISSIARGDVIGGGNGLIDSLATHGRRVLEYQYSPGLFQDFPVGDRRIREETLRGKPKKVSHKGGRGGINAPKRRKMNISNEGGDHVDEDVHLGDENHVVEGGDQEFADLFDGETLTDAIVQPSDSRYVPSFRLLPSNDFLTPDEQPPVEESVEEQPELLASDDFLNPPPIDQHGQQHQPLEESGHQQQPPVNEVGQEQPLVEGIVEEQPVVEQEAAHEEHHMRLRARNRHPPKCGTDGIKKVPEVKNRYERIRKKKA